MHWWWWFCWWDGFRRDPAERARCLTRAIEGGNTRSLHEFSLFFCFIIISECDIAIKYTLYLYSSAHKAFVFRLTQFHVITSTNISGISEIWNMKYLLSLFLLWILLLWSTNISSQLLPHTHTHTVFVFFTPFLHIFIYSSSFTVAQSHASQSSIARWVRCYVESRLNLNWILKIHEWLKQLIEYLMAMKMDGVYAFIFPAIVLHTLFRNW